MLTIFSERIVELSSTSRLVDEKKIVDYFLPSRLLVD